MENIFKNIFTGKVVIVGIGNIMKGDDAFGPALIERLKKKKTNTVLIDAGNSLEKYTGKIAKENPDTILFVDATHLDEEAGKYQVLMPEDIIKSALTTHDISPAMIIDYLKNQTKAKIYMLGVQPKNISLGEGMSESVKKTLEEICELVTEVTNA